MAIIETKFSIGDVVYRAGITTVTKKHPCPDCGGTKTWKAVSPAGGEYEFACPRCTSNFMHNDDLSLSYSCYEPSISRLTIGSIRVDTSSDRRNEYMCVETGIGSGSIYAEGDLFHTEEEATTVAKLKAADADKSVEWVAKRFNRTLQLSDYQLTNAEREANKALHSKRMSMIRGFFDNLEWSDDVDAMRKAVEEFRELPIEA